jgi:tetratricopeptide (TPR) repeat protein
MTTEVTALAPTLPATAAGAEPYVGPRPFEQKDAPFFFGRDGEAYELMCRVVANSEVLLYAQSGAGKTSLINAKLIPLLRKERCEMLPLARVHKLVQGVRTESVPNLYVFHTLVSWDPDDDPKSLVGQTLSGFLSSRACPANAEEAEEDDLHPPRVAIFDQFEELFTAYPERWQERKGFFEQVREALKADSNLRVVFSMREDHIAALDPYLRILPEKMRIRFRLERLRREGALAAVKKPLERLTQVRRTFADGVAERLVENLLQVQVQTETGEAVAMPGEYVEAVQLQVACQTLWQNLPASVTEITEAELQNFGDVNQALATFYEKAVHATVHEKGTPEGRLRRWFSEELITPAGTRGLVYRGSFETAGIPNEVVDDLEGIHHLLRGEERAGAHWYELSHDRFIRPIQESNRRWFACRAGAEQMRQQLEARTRKWTEQGQSHESLLDEVELREADRWLQSAEAADLGGANEAVLAFTQASRTAVQAARREKERELEHARVLATEQQRRAEAERQRAEAEALRAREQARDAARLRRLAGALAALAAIAIGALLFSIIEFRQARAAQDEATKNFNEARTAQDEATAQRKEAEGNFEMAHDAVDKMLAEVAEKLTHVPQLEEMRQNLLEGALDFHQRFREKKNSDPQILLGTARAHEGVGDIEWLRNRRNEAKAAYQAEIDLLEPLMNDFPDFQSRVAQAYRKLGKLMAQDGSRLDTAEDYLHKGLDIQRKLEAGTEAPKNRWDLARSLNDLAMLLQESGKHAEAVKVYKEAMRLQEKLVGDDPTNPDYRFDLARTCNGLGELLRDSGEQSEAQRMHENARTLLDALIAEKQKKNAYYRRHLAISYHHLGVLLKNDAEFSGAERHYREALKIQKALVEDFPTVPFYQHDQALTLQDLGILLKDTGRLQEVVRTQGSGGISADQGHAAPPLLPASAEEAHRLAIEIRKKLAERFATYREYNQALAHSYSNLGGLLSEIGRREEAEKEHNEALKLREELANDFPNVPVYRQEQARTLNNLAVLLSYDSLGVPLKEGTRPSGIDRKAEAETKHREALKIREKLVSDHPNAPSYRQELVVSLNNLGTLLKDMDKSNREKAEGLYRRAVKEAEQLIKFNLSYKEDLASGYSNLGALLNESGHKNALEYYQEANKLCQQLHDQWPKAPVYKARLAASHYRLGMMRQTSDKAGGLRQSLIEYEKANRLEPDNGAFLLARHFAYAELGQTREANVDYLAAVERSNAVTLRGDRRWNSRHDGAQAHLDAWRSIVVDASALIKSHEDPWWLWRGQALAHAALGEWNKAAAGFSKAIELRPKDAEAWYGRARAHAELGQLDAAAVDCRRVVDLNGDDWSLWFLWGNIHERQGQFKDAIEKYTRAIELRAFPLVEGSFAALAPPSGKCLIAAAAALALGSNEWRKDGWAVVAHRGYAYNRSALYNEGISDYNTVLLLKPDDSIAYNNRGVNYMHRRAQEGTDKKADYARAIEDFKRAIEKDEKSALARANLGEVYRLDEQLDKAIEEVNKALDLNRKFPLAFEYRGRIHFDKKDYDRAIEDYSEVLKITPHHLLAYTRRGDAYAEQENYVEADVNFAEAIELIRKGRINSQDIQVWLAHTRLQLRARNTEGYRCTCEEMLTRFGKPTSAASANSTAWACVLADSAVTDPQRPVQLAEYAVGKAPPGSRYAYLNTLGAALYRAGNWDGAVKKLNEARMEHDSKAEGTALDWLYLAMAHHRLGDPTEAHKWLDKATKGEEKAARADAGSNKPPKWGERVELELLRREAEKLLATKAPSPGT